MHEAQIALIAQEKPHHTGSEVFNKGTMNFEQSHQKILYIVLSERKERQDIMCNDAVGQTFIINPTRTKLIQETALWADL